jgi:hypothetical protein
VGDEGWPFGVALAGGGFKPPQAAIGDEPVVVSVEEKAPVRCQVGIRKASGSESLMTCREESTDIETGAVSDG